MQLIDNYFINRKLKELNFKHDMMNIQDGMRNASSILIVIPRRISFLNNIFKINDTLKKSYPDADLSYMALSYFHMYKEILESPVHPSAIPTPTKFRELDNITMLKKKLGNIDLYIDFSDMRFEYRLMFERILRPKMAISMFDEGLKDDFNILVKAENELRMLEMTGMEITGENGGKVISELAGPKPTERFDIVYIGNDRKVRNGVKTSMNEGRRFMHIADLDDKLSLSTIKHIVQAKEILTDKHNDEAVRFIRKLVHL